MKKLIYAGLFTSLIAFQANAAGYYIKNIEVSGLERVERETVLSYLNLSSNKNVSQEELDASFKSLYNTGLFSDIDFDISTKNVLKINKRKSDYRSARIWR